MTEVTRQLRVLDDGDDIAMLRVAFATSDRKMINQHFGSASSFAIYGVNPEDSRLLTVIEFGDLTHDEDKLAAKLELLKDCIAVYCRACGASAVRQLLTQGIQPVKVSEGATIEEMISALQDELRSGPSSWLAKAIQRNGDLGRFDAMESEGWIE
ncbi:NifB/NifX family molybdenum-iron cluster-binding protein [Pseudomaricurvus sp. HS19]|uniref:NifB/NifX family molybdenum-iron cluster-binding protein n=1 Tax=Pseudomaricurvus sp. HS19 TaxID=2692626 RepID=UPI00136E0F37|nr:NifB/NifX family molybdenum-iron cluster-binding protein [Pseudomaricurvus sp. HS19]MYM62486.1 nitrogen fixation protein NifX [Pseudomaricurvus sp. HS19]